MDILDRLSELRTVSDDGGSKGRDGTSVETLKDSYTVGCVCSPPDVRAKMKASAVMNRTPSEYPCQRHPDKVTEFQGENATLQFVKRGNLIDRDLKELM